MTQLGRRNVDMLNGPVFKNIILYTIPIILTGFLQLLFNAADLVVVGRFCGELSVAAVGNAGAVTNLLVNMFVGFSSGTSVLTAQAIGGRRDEDVHRIVHTAVPLALVCGAFVMAVGIGFSERLLITMNTPLTVLPLSVLYIRIYFAGAVFSMVYNFSAAILRAAGDTRSPLIFLTISGVVNVILNVIFVTLLDMNVAGVALATIISQALSAFLVVRLLMRREDACRLVLSKLRFYKAHLTKMIYMGLPAGLQSSLFSISNIFIQSSINGFGDIVMSGNAAAGNIEGFVYTGLNSFMQTTMNFIGQNVGARKFERVKEVFYKCLIGVFVMGLITTAIIGLFGRSLLSFYIVDSPEALGWGILRFQSICFAFCICGLMDVATGALRGLGAAVVPMVVSVLGVCGLRILWIYTIFSLPRYHSPQWLYYSYPITWTITVVVEVIAFFIVFRKKAAEDHT